MLMVIVSIFLLMTQKYSHSQGFTLIELLVVIAIIGLLATIALMTLTSLRATARDTRRISDVNLIVRAAQVMNQLNQTPPDTSMGFEGWCCLGFLPGEYCYGHVGGTP